MWAEPVVTHAPARVYSAATFYGLFGEMRTTAPAVENACKLAPPEHSLKREMQFTRWQNTVTRSAVSPRSAPVIPIRRAEARQGREETNHQACAHTASESCA